MYLNYFGLSDNPFSIAPNPDYLYMSPRHKEALAHLTFGLRESGGFVMLTGEVGTGKTTVSRKLLQLDGDYRIGRSRWVRQPWWLRQQSHRRL